MLAVARLFTVESRESCVSQRAAGPRYKRANQVLEHTILSPSFLKSRTTFVCSAVILLARSAGFHWAPLRFGSSVSGNRPLRILTRLLLGLKEITRSRGHNAFTCINATSLGRIIFSDIVRFNEFAPHYLKMEVCGVLVKSAKRRIAERENVEQASGGGVSYPQKCFQSRASLAPKLIKV